MIIHAEFIEINTSSPVDFIEGNDTIEADVVGYIGSGTDHRRQRYRDAADQHPISAITGLTEALAQKMDAGEYRTAAEQDEIDARKVTRVEGLVLSKNSFTDEEKEKLEGIEEGAQVNEVNEAPDDGAAYVRKEKAWEKSPTKLSDFSDDVGFALASDVSEALAEKQDVISDLEDIRDGAEAGSTALQPSALSPYRTAAAQDAIDAGKQDVISDLEDIREGAEAGSTALQPSALSPYRTASAQDEIDAGFALASDVSEALAEKQDVISDLEDIRDGAEAGASAAQPADVSSAINSKITYGTTDIGEGAPLSTGIFYFVYED